MFIFTLKYSQLQIVFVLMCTYTYNNTSKKNIVEKRKCNESITEVKIMGVYLFTCSKQIIYTVWKLRQIIGQHCILHN